MMAESYWVEADRERFTAAWLAELATVPEFRSSTNPSGHWTAAAIWKRLPHESTRVYRLQTDTGERIIGRKVSPRGWRPQPKPVRQPHARCRFMALRDAR